MSTDLYIARTGIVLTDRCTLRCRLCAEFSPYYKNPAHPPLEKIEAGIDSFFSLVDSVGDFSLYGGEPMLYEGFYQTLRYMERYENRFRRLLVLTNGTILPSEKELVSLKELTNVCAKLRFHISDYGPALSRKVHDSEVILNKLGIDYRIICYWGDNSFCNGWTDLVDSRKKYFTSEEIIAHAQKCEFRKHPYSSIHFYNGEFYFVRCSRAVWRYLNGITPKDTNVI